MFRIGGVGGTGQNKTAQEHVLKISPFHHTVSFIHQ